MAVETKVEGVIDDVPAPDEVVALAPELQAPLSRDLLGGWGFKSPEAGRLSLAKSRTEVCSRLIAGRFSVVARGTRVSSAELVPCAGHSTGVGGFVGSEFKCA